MKWAAGDWQIVTGGVESSFRGWLATHISELLVYKNGSPLTY